MISLVVSHVSMVESWPGSERADFGCGGAGPIMVVMLDGMAILTTDKIISASHCVFLATTFHISIISTGRSKRSPCLVPAHHR